MRQVYGLCRNRCDVRDSCHTDFLESLKMSATCGRHVGLSASWKTLGSIKSEMSANLRDKRQGDYRRADSATAVSAGRLLAGKAIHCLQTLDGVAACPRDCKVSIGYGVENRMLPIAPRRKFR